MKQISFNDAQYRYDNMRDESWERAEQEFLVDEGEEALEDVKDYIGSIPSDIDWNEPPF